MKIDIGISLKIKSDSSIFIAFDHAVEITFSPKKNNNNKNSKIQSFFHETFISTNALINSKKKTQKPSYEILSRNEKKCAKMKPIFIPEIRSPDSLLIFYSNLFKNIKE